MNIYLFSGIHLDITNSDHLLKMKATYDHCLPALKFWCNEKNEYLLRSANKNVVLEAWEATEIYIEGLDPSNTKKKYMPSNARFRYIPKEGVSYVGSDGQRVSLHNWYTIKMEDMIPNSGLHRICKKSYSGKCEHPLKGHHKQIRERAKKRGMPQQGSTSNNWEQHPNKLKNPNKEMKRIFQRRNIGKERIRLLTNNFHQMSCAITSPPIDMKHTKPSELIKKALGANAPLRFVDMEDNQYPGPMLKILKKKESAMKSGLVFIYIYIYIYI